MGDIKKNYPLTLFFHRLHDTAPEGSSVVRLVGNHDLLWIQGDTRDRNRLTDTPEKINDILADMKARVLKGAIKGAHHYLMGNQSVVFVHGGIREDMARYLLKHAQPPHDDHKPAAVTLVNTINKQLVDAVKKCEHHTLVCRLTSEVFEAGADRGGDRIGGPFWTDFTVLEKESQDRQQNQDGDFIVTSFIQVVGHTARKNLFRHTVDFTAMCIDAGLYQGSKFYFEITKEGHFVANVLRPTQWEGYQWISTDISDLNCKKQTSEL